MSQKTMEPEAARRVARDWALVDGPLHPFVETGIVHDHAALLADIDECISEARMHWRRSEVTELTRLRRFVQKAMVAVPGGWAAPWWQAQA